MRAIVAAAEVFACLAVAMQAKAAVPITTDQVGSNVVASDGGSPDLIDLATSPAGFPFPFAAVAAQFDELG